MPARTTTGVSTTEAAILAELAIAGPSSGYDLLRKVKRTIGFVWTPAKSRLYAVLPRLVEAGLASRERVAQETRPDKLVYTITPAGREALDAWLAAVEPGSVETFYLRLFAGGLMSRETLVAHVEQFRRDAAGYLAELRALEPMNTRSGDDYYSWFMLRLGIDRTELTLRWCDDVLAELRREDA